MRWFTRLLRRRLRQSRTAPLWIHVQCQRCSEAIRVRVDRRYDLASEMLDPGEAGPAYTMHKDIVGERCFQRLAVDLAFDRSFRVVEQRIAGGTFINEAEYQAAVAARPHDDTHTE